MIGDISQLVETIKQIKNNNQFKNFIDYIQFPFYKNLELDQRVNFVFPLTVFVGPNGCGKSSTLHALYGCPKGFTPSRFWFSSVLDPVVYVSQDGRKLRHCFYYGYKNEDFNELQVLKSRIRREDNPDYWETSRPLKGIGMNDVPDDQERNSPIEKNVIFLDFRSQLSAFDKYFYFETPSSHLVSKTKQDYLRIKSKQLKNLFDKQYVKAFSPSGAPQNEPVVELSEEQLLTISDILSKNYLEIKSIYHKLFHNWGDSILLKTKHHKYSEAAAGSGEMSVIMLVIAVLNAVDNSLILLDEPEVSLHPGAQKKMKLFLLDQIKKKKHQIIISTHSPAIIEGLPKEAIKVFSQREDSGKFIVKENILHEEAFYFIGHQLDEKISILAEDKLATKIIEKVLEKLGPEVKNRFLIRPIPGGAETINKHYIPVYSNTNNPKYFFILDGDKKRVAQPFDVLTLQEKDKNEEFINAKIKEQTGCNIKFLVDGDTGAGNVAQRIEMMIQFLKYHEKHVRYLPMSTPEDFIWSDEIVRQKLNQQDYDQNIDNINSLENSKQKIFESSKIFFGVDTQIDAFEDMLINEWIKREDSNYFAVKSIIESF